MKRQYFNNITFVIHVIYPPIYLQKYHTELMSVCQSIHLYFVFQSYLNSKYQIIEKLILLYLIVIVIYPPFYLYIILKLGISTNCSDLSTYFLQNYHTEIMFFSDHTLKFCSSILPKLKISDHNVILSCYTLQLQ